jgi:hypothetical protein
MSFSDKISSLQSSAERQLHALGSKKKTENALILPFFDMLGYNPFDIREVEPDYEIGREERGTETVDYALKKEGTPTVLFQCTEAKTDLEAYENDARKEVSLFEYFDELEADLAAFTNGLTYRFYANLEADVRVEARPFLEFNLLGYEPDQVQALERFSKSVFDRDEILAAAHDLQTGQLLRSYFARQQESPDDHFVRFLAAQVYDGEISGSQLERFRPLVQEVLGEFGEGEGEGQSQPDQEGRALPEQTGESAPRDLEAGVEGTLSEEAKDGGGRSDDEAPTNEDDEDGSGPFDKDLAQRVIDDF